MIQEKTENQPGNPSPLVSFHGFAFPFEWHVEKRARDQYSAGPPQLQKLNKLLLEDDRWIAVVQSDAPGAAAQYNESNYFYDFVRPALYDSTLPGAGKMLHCYRRKLDEGAAYRITTGKKTYQLQVAVIELKLYAIGIGILSLHLLNTAPDQADPEDILQINQYGRRLFPPFYDIAHTDPGSKEYYGEARWEKVLEVGHPELPLRLELTGAGNTGSRQQYLNHGWEKPQLNPVPGLIRQLLPATVLALANITPVLDDRMFVLCWYGNRKLADNCIKLLKKEAVTNPTPDLKDDWWYRYVFVDGENNTCQDAGMMETLLRAHTYPRWSGYGTLSGVARYSWVTLSASLSDNIPAFIVAHTRTIYFRAVELALLQRACVLRFSDEITRISALSANDRHLPARMENLFREYLGFINKLNFREVTAQEQGIELYDMLRRSMRLEEQIKDLDAQMQELHNYASALGENARNAKLDLLTYLGALLGVPTFIATMHGAMEYKLNEHPWWPMAWVYGTAVVSALLYIRAGKKWQRIVCLLVLAILLVVGALAPGWNK